MITKPFRLRDNVPDYYIENSRDFQLLCNLYDSVQLMTRYYIQSMSLITDTKNCPNRLLDLLGLKVGFQPKLHYPDEIQRVLTQAFPYIIRYKGSVQGVKFALNTYQRAVNLTSDYNFNSNIGDFAKFSIESNQSLTIESTKVLPYMNILNDLLRYILPGIKLDYKIIKPEENEE